MRKSLRRVLDRLRTAAGGKAGKATSVRGGLQVPQKMQPLTVSTRTRPPR